MEFYRDKYKKSLSRQPLAGLCLTIGSILIKGPPVEAGAPAESIEGLDID